MGPASLRSDFRSAASRGPEPRRSAQTPLIFVGGLFFAPMRTSRVWCEFLVAINGGRCKMMVLIIDAVPVFGCVLAHHRGGLFAHLSVHSACPYNKSSVIMCLPRSSRTGVFSRRTRLTKPGSAAIHPLRSSAIACHGCSCVVESTLCLVQRPSRPAEGSCLPLPPSPSEQETRDWL